MTDTNAIEILKILGHAMGSSKPWFDERNFLAGYHTINVNGKKYKGQRDPEQRLKKIRYDFTDKTVLDIGCSSGGVLFALADKIKIGFGLDFSEKYINAANALKAANSVTNVHFYTFNLDKENLEIISSLSLGKKIDLCFFMNLALWVSRWKEALRYCAQISEKIIFEAHGTEVQKADQINYINSIFSSITQLSGESEDDSTYSSREMFLCEGFKVPKQTKNNLEIAPQINIKLVKEVCNKYLNLESGPKVNMNLAPSESVIAEVNNQFIIKFPKPRRGKHWNLCEKAITDFLSGRITIRIPKSNAATYNNIEFLWYEKIFGQHLNEKTYSGLDERTQTNIANQIAEFMHCLHSIDPSELKEIECRPSWQINEESFSIVKEVLDEDMLKIVAKVQDFYKNYIISEQDTVFGHFDLHDSNIILDTENNTVGIIDFGNCKIGDLHQDLSMLTLSSVLLSDKVIDCYIKLSGKTVSANKIKNFTILYLLNLIAEHHRAGNLRTVQKWKKYLSEFCHLSDNRQTCKKDKTAMQNDNIINNEWKKWAFENFVAGQNVENLVSIMVEKGIAEKSAQELFNDISTSPYLAVTKQYQEKLNKREWLLKTLDWHKRQLPDYTKPRKVPLPPFKQFLEEYYFQNKIGIFSGAIDHWGAAKWTFPDLVEKVGYESMVEVQTGREKERDYEVKGVSLKTQIKFGEFIDKITSVDSSNDMYMTANNQPFKNQAMQKLLADFDNIGDGYFNMDDFANRAFLWLGPKGVITPLHHDLTNNFFIQVYGKKVYHLIPSMQVPYMYDSVHVYSDVKLLESDLSQYPKFKKTSIIQVELEPGDSLFIPIGCWHHVVGLTPNISLTITNMNVNNNFPR